MGNASKADLILEAETINPIVAAMPRHQVQAVIDTFLQSAINAMRLKKTVVLKGFGSFDVRPTRARRGRNPRTGEAIEIPAGYKVRFKAGSLLDEAIRATEEID